MRDEILALLDYPVELERLYRSAPDAFAAALPDALAESPESMVLQVWRARLEPIVGDRGGATQGGEAKSGLMPVLLHVAGISLLVTVLLKLPLWLTALDAAWYYGRYGAAIACSGVTLYFIVERREARRYLFAIGLTTVACVAYLAMLPSAISSDSALLALLHLPIVFLALTGVAFAGPGWPLTVARMGFIRFCGELVVYSSIILLGGIVLSALTFALFRLIGISIEAWYERNVILWGVASSPLVAAFLVDRIVGRGVRAAGLLARIFAPLFLVMAVAYLGAMFIEQRSPYADRNFLVTFNGLLILILGLTTFCLSENAQGARVGIYDYLNVALISVTLVIDVIALSAILYRLVEFGLTPNRVVVLGANLLIFVNLAGIAWQYGMVLMQRRPYESVAAFVARYLSYYVLWCLFVGFSLPLLFDFA